MGFGEVATQVILFIAVLSMATGLVITVKTFTDKSADTQRQVSDAYNNKIKTNINIDVVSYSNITKNLTIYAKNLGSTNINPNSLDIYLDGVRIPRNVTNRTIAVENDTDKIDIGTWNPKEEVKILVKTFPLNNTITHKLLLVTPYDTKDELDFSVQ